MNVFKKWLKRWLSSLLFEEGIKIGTHTITINPSYIDLGGGNLINIGGVSGSLVPTTTNFNLGSPTYKWAALYGNTLSFSYIASDLIPNSTNTYNIGSASYSWKDIYLAGAVRTNLVPGADNTYSLGNVTNRFIYYIPILASRPAAGASYTGEILAIRSGANQKTYLYVCVQNSSNVYEWIQVGIST